MRMRQVRPFLCELYYIRTFEPKMFTREKCSQAFVILDDLNARLSAINYVSEI